MNFQRLDIDRIYRAFSPAKEISDPNLFAGRKAEVRSGVQGLLNRGGFLAIYGLRGVGKSSIALQIRNIAEGNKILPNMMAINKLLPRKGFDYIVHYYKGDTFIHNIADLFKRILFGDENNLSLFSLTKAGDKTGRISQGSQFGRFSRCFRRKSARRRTRAKVVQDICV